MMKKIFQDKKIIMTMLSILLVLSIMSSTTYSLLFSVDTLKNVESYTAGELVINVDKGESLTLTNSLPLTDEDGKKSTPYIFTVENKGNLTYTFDLSILPTTSSNMVNPNYIKIQVDDGEINTLSSLEDGLIYDDISLNPNQTTTVSVRIWLDYNTPNTEIGKSFSAKMVITGIGSENVSSYEILTNLGLEQYLEEGTPDFSAPESTNAGIYEAEDDYGKSYYFRGAVENNYVKFAGYDWRIVRINGDGSIRLIYEGKDGDATAGTEKSQFNENANDNMYVGFMYTSGEVHGLGTESSVKTALDEWYEKSGLKTYEQYIDTNAGFCGDRQPGTTTKIDYSSGRGIGIRETVYAGDIRLRRNTNPSIPTLECIKTEDLYTHSSSITGNNKLDNPVGLITADEVVFAGGFWSPGSSSTDQNHYLNIRNFYWTMTPSMYYSAGTRMIVVNTLGYVTSAAPNSSYILRPVINLKANTEFFEDGTGTQDNPFVVKTTGNQILDGKNVVERPEINTTLISSTTNTVYKTEDNDGTSYYFAGNPTDNYVEFAGYDWRIVRINGDGTVRLIYEGKDDDVTAGTQTSMFNENANASAYVGFMYTEDVVHGLDNSSNAKDKLDEWYNNSGLKDYEQYIDINAGFCGDREPDESSNNSTIYYAGDIRLQSNKNPSIPSLKCIANEDLYTHKSSVKGNMKLDNPVGLITADEVVFAGGFWVPRGATDQKHYLNIGVAYWTMTPRIYYSAGARMMIVTDNGYITSDSPSAQYVLRPVINLKKDLNVTGTGIQGDPYKFELK